ncbi:DUF3224 domain-containing protein [Sphaerisporangium sp. B11E5]|uniref:DUF3224 domain-containing protein n=1 Tax=Sphaerisporangium sp. B11E5 TaxID=3153563 RepID=UPI00325F4828
MPRATGGFHIESWDQETIDDREGATIGRVHVTKTFHGDLEGTSTADLLTAAGQVEGSAAYVAFERFTGTAHGRKGSFVLHHTASGSGGERSLSWTILPDSGTGELKGVTGGGDIVIQEDGGHAYVLDYELP